MKQKIVIKICMNTEKSRTKAKTTISKIEGVNSWTLKDNCVFEIVGDEVDHLQLMKDLNKVGPCDLLLVEEEKDEKDEKKEKDDDKKDDEVTVTVPSCQCALIYHPQPYYYVPYDRPYADPPCSIM